jgi:large repetitive protein
MRRIVLAFLVVFVVAAAQPADAGSPATERKSRFVRVTKVFTSLEHSTGSSYFEIPEAYGTAGPAYPYPGIIRASGLKRGRIVDVNLTLRGLSGNDLPDVDLLLVAPNGAAVLVMSDIAAGVQDSTPIGDIVIDDEALTMLPELRSALVAGRYRPTNYGSGDVFSAPAPVLPEVPFSVLSHLDGGRANGEWRLFAMNDSAGGDTRITSWELRISARVRR